MAFRSTKVSRVYIGIVRASAYADTVSNSFMMSVDPTTTLEDLAPTSIPGRNTSTFSCSGPLDTDATANGQADALNDINGSTTNTPITYLPLGSDGAAWLTEAIATDYPLSSTLDAAIQWSFAAQTSGPTDFNGVVLSPLTAITADTDNASVDNGASTANGGVAHLHVTAFSGLTSNVVTVEHSANNSTWATLATFTSATGVTSQRLEVAAGTTVNRYLRITDNVTGTGSCTRVVAFSRR